MTNMLLTYGGNISIAKSAGDILFNLWFQFWTFRIILLVRNSCNVVSGGRDFFLKSFSKAILGDWIWGRGERVFLPFIFSVSIFFSVVSAFCQAEICNFQVTEAMENTPGELWHSCRENMPFFLPVPNTKSSHSKVMMFWKQILLVS